MKRYFTEILILVSLFAVVTVAQPVPSGAGANLTLSNVNATTARTNLGLKSAAIYDVGFGANNVLKLDSNGQLPVNLLAVYDTAANINGMVLNAGEFASTSDTHEIRQGDGSTSGGIASFFSSSANDARYLRASNNFSEMTATSSAVGANLGIPFGRYALADSNVSTNYTVTADQGGQVLDVDTSAGNVTISLPPVASVRPGWTLTLRKKTSDTFTASTSPATINLTTIKDTGFIYGDGVSYRSAQWLQRATNGQLLVGTNSTWEGVALSGDATLSSAGTLTLATTNGNVGGFGDSTHIPSFTVNGKGLITAASSNAITIPSIASTSAILKGNGSGNAVAATADTDYQSPLTFTTTGSGAATFSAHTLNVPTPAIPAAANPTATIGTTAVNGSASTFMRSDASPALPIQSLPLFVQSNDTTFTGDDAAHTMFSFSVPGGTLGSTGVIWIDFVLTRTSGASTINFTTTFGGTVISAPVTLSSSNSTFCRVRLAASGATGTQRLTLFILNSSSSSSITVDSTAAKTLSAETTNLASGTNLRVDSVAAYIAK